jgi:hypothetical protein
LVSDQLTVDSLTRHTSETGSQYELRVEFSAQASNSKAMPRTAVLVEPLLERWVNV